jgi:leucyl-tRNA---protein transferase
MSSRSIRFFQTGEHRCGYWPARSARDILLDPEADDLDVVYPDMLALGFRRSGGIIYRPRCAACNDCVPLRVEVDAFRPTRSQRRCQRTNADLVWDDTTPGYSDERFALYRDYLGARHRHGGMDDPAEDDFLRFLAAPWSPTRFLEARLQGRLVAVAVTDVVADALSAVYTFFDPRLERRSLGTASILQQLQRARSGGHRYLYLGYWLHDHPRMAYKRGFAGAELLGEQGWQPVTAPAA